MSGIDWSEIIVSGGVGYMLGRALTLLGWGRKARLPARCRAHFAMDKWSGFNNKYYHYGHGPQCKDSVDPRCINNLCTSHCREPGRCNGECVT